MDGTASTFYLNLCENVASNPGSTPVGDTTVSSCLKQGDTFTNVGNHNDTLQLTINENTGGFRLDYRGSVCNVTEKYQTTIDFKCGTTLVGFNSFFLDLLLFGNQSQLTIFATHYFMNYLYIHMYNCMS